MKKWASCFAVLFLLATNTFSLADQFQAAETFLKNREFDKAADAFLAFVQDEPSHSDAPLALYTAARTRLLAQDRPDEAKILFQQLNEAYSDNEWAFYGALKLGEYFLDQGDSLRTADAYEQAVNIGGKIFPPVADASDAQFTALKKCGELYLDLRRYIQAEPYFSRLLEADIDDRRAMPDIYTKLAACHEGEGRGEDAAKTYLRLIELYPTSRQACGLCQAKDKIDPYATYEWDPYEYFVEGYTVFRTWPSKAAEHMVNLESKGGSADLVQTANRLLPWVYLYSTDFEKAQRAYESFQNRYPDDPDPYALYFPMYLNSYQEEYDFKKFATTVSVLVSEADTTASPTPDEEYSSISMAEGWKVLDLEPHYGFYNHLLHVNRSLNSTDLAYLRIFLRTDQHHTTKIEIDNDDPWAVWLNGNYVGEYTDHPGTTDLDLVSGWNEVVVKLTQKEGEMNATMRFIDDTGEIDADLVYSATKE